MSAECSRCGWDLPFQASCVVCNEHGTFERQLAEAQEENRRLREEMRRWVAAYSPDIVTYPSPEAIRAVNETPEFIVGRNAMMQAIHDGLARILKEE